MSSRAAGELLALSTELGRSAEMVYAASSSLAEKTHTVGSLLREREGGKGVAIFTQFMVQPMKAPSNCWLWFYKEKPLRVNGPVTHAH